MPILKHRVVIGAPSTNAKVYRVVSAFYKVSLTFALTFSLRFMTLTKLIVTTHDAKWSGVDSMIFDLSGRLNLVTLLTAAEARKLLTRRF